MGNCILFELTYSAVLLSENVINVVKFLDSCEDGVVERLSYGLVKQRVSGAKFLLFRKLDVAMLFKLQYPEYIRRQYWCNVDSVVDDSVLLYLRNIVGYKQIF